MKLDLLNLDREHAVSVLVVGYAHFLRQLAFRSMLKIAGWMCPPGRRDELGSAIYWRSMHNPNLDVVNREAFVERVCRPQLGWWR